MVTEFLMPQNTVVQLFFKLMSHYITLEIMEYTVNITSSLFIQQRQL